jgi:hypothetical protein
MCDFEPRLTRRAAANTDGRTPPHVQQEVIAAYKPKAEEE